jgi:hypothetical protein
MAALCERVNMRIAEIHEFPDIHGGTLRFLLEASLCPHCTKAREMIQAEYLIGLTEIQTYEDFKSRVFHNFNDLMKVLREYKGPRVAYGASAKLSTLLGYMKNKMVAPPTMFSFIVDDNSLKVGKFQIDSDLKIQATTTLKDLEKPLIVVTAHNFYKEIKQRLTSMGISATLCKWVPDVSVEEI